MAKNWKKFFLNSLKQKVPTSKDNLFVNQKIQKGGAVRKNPVQIISPTVQATNQARDTVKNGAFADNELYVNRRPIVPTQLKSRTVRKVKPQKSRKTTKNIRKSNKRKEKRTIRKYKK